MADEDLDIANLDPAEPANWQRLREYAERQQKRAMQTASLERENAFLRAGIDLSTRLGQAFAATYDGKLDDIAAIRADATDFDPRIVASSGGASPGGAEGQATQDDGSAPVENQAPQNTGTQERNALADGGMPAGNQPLDTRTGSRTRAVQLLDEGRPYEVAAGELVAMRAKGIQDGTFPRLGADGRRIQGN